MGKAYGEEDVSAQGVITLDDILGKQEEASFAQQEKTVIEETQSLPEPAGMKEITADAVEERQIRMIENPLPVPKRREHKEMDYMLTDIPENDDFDLKDMTGIDFFDIE